MINIFIDIETLPTSRADVRERAAKDVAPPGNYKKEEAISEWWAREGAARKEEAIAKTALDGTWGEIVCIGYAVNDAPVEVIARALTEADLLNHFGVLLDSQCKKQVRSGETWQPIAQWIGHNVQDFDLRFIWQRSRLLGVRLPFLLPVGKLPYGRGPTVYDTMREWAGWKGYVKQTDLELAFGLQRSDPLPNGGADVYEAFQKGEIDTIKAHCREDVRLLRDLYTKLAA